MVGITRSKVISFFFHIFFFDAARVSLQFSYLESLGFIFFFFGGFGNENQDMNRYSERSQSHPAMV